MKKLFFITILSAAMSFYSPVCRVYGDSGICPGAVIYAGISPGNPPVITEIRGTPFFRNIAYDYSIKLDGSFLIDYGDSQDDFDEKAVEVNEAGGAFSVCITSDRLDDDTMELVRMYYGNDTSSDEEIFIKFTDYKKSYYNAMLEYYTTDRLYGDISRSYGETDMKIFGRFNREMFGQDSEIIIYNIITSGKSGITEKTHVDILLPVTRNKTFYSINFTLDKGALDENALLKMKSFLNSVCINGSHNKSGFLNTPEESDAAAASCKGIYPEPHNTERIYTDFLNTYSGYCFTYPSVFTPCMQNNIARPYDYRSFKIDFYSCFSVAVEPVYDENEAIEHKISLIKELNRGKINITDEGIFSPGGIEFYFISYETSNGNTPVYLEDYFAIHGGRLYGIQLSSRIVKPSADIREEFLKILASFRFDKTPVEESYTVDEPVSFVNREEGYAFSYPGSWQVAEMSQDVNYDHYSIKFTHLSGLVDVSVSEGEMNGKMTPVEILECVTGKDEQGLAEHFKKYEAPYLGRPSRVLAENYSIPKDGVVYLDKLINYLDSNNRARLCYSRDIVKGSKIYTLSVSVADYATEEGRISHESLDKAVNFISSSFKLENTWEALIRTIIGETRNRKVLFIEDFFKKKYGQDAYVTSTINLNSANDILVNLDGVPERGFYRVNLNYQEKKVEVVSSLLKSDIKEICRSLLADIFGSNAQVHFPPDGIFMNESHNKYGSVLYQTPVYIEVNGLSGYPLLIINAITGSVELESYKSLDEIYEEVRRMYQVSNDGFRLVSYRMSDSDKFEILVFSASEQNDVFKITRLPVGNSVHFIHIRK